MVSIVASFGLATVWATFQNIGQIKKSFGRPDFDLI